MLAEESETNPSQNDPDRWGHSLTNLGELLVGCLDASGARSVAEVGAYAGDLTGLLLDWAAGVGGQVIAIEPTPHPNLAALSERRPELDLIREPSHEALRHISLPDAVIIDGDHNYFTVSGELGIVGERAPGAEIPLLMFHDIGWPHGRRDAYWDPGRVPDEHRQPTDSRPLLFPGEPGLADEGMLMYTSAVREGGPGNGVLTALEDFLEGRPDLRLATVPAFFGFGIVWHRDASGASALSELIKPWDRHPVLERLEANRVHHLATSLGRETSLTQARAELEDLRSENASLEEQRAAAEAELAGLRARSLAQERVLRALLHSGGLRLADRLSALRHPGRGWSWPGRVRSALGEDSHDPPEPT